MGRRTRRLLSWSHRVRLPMRRWFLVCRIQSARSGSSGVSSSKRPAKKPAAAGSRSSPHETAKPRRGAPPPPTRRPPTSARLTIKRKPGAPALIDLPPRPRPGGVRRLSEVELDEDEILIEGFDAQLSGVMVRVTAVRERTWVDGRKGGVRRMVNVQDRRESRGSCRRVEGDMGIL